MVPLLPRSRPFRRAGRIRLLGHCCRFGGDERPRGHNQEAIRVRYREALRARLQERYRRLYKGVDGALHNEIGYLVDFIHTTPALTAIVNNLEGAVPELDPSRWLEEHVTWQQYEDRKSTRLNSSHR